jgi:hypothetical protein
MASLQIESEKIPFEGAAAYFSLVIDVLRLDPAYEY